MSKVDNLDGVMEKFDRRFRLKKTINLVISMVIVMIGIVPMYIVFAKKAGHKVTEIRPGLAPLKIKEDYPARMQGLSLRNVSVSFFDKDNKKIYEDFGELLFTHFGVKNLQKRK